METKKYKLIGFFVLGFLIFSSATNVAIASDDDLDGIDDDFESSKTRTLNINFEEDKIEIESILRSNLSKNKIEFEIRNNTNGLEVGVEFTPNYDPLTNSSEIELEFEINFQEIVEYVDVNQNNIFEEGIDTEVQTVQLDAFQSTQYSIISISPETDLHYFIVKTIDGIFIAHIYISEEFEIVNNTLITPSETKIAIEINNFVYNNPNSRLALYIKLESEIDYEEKETTEDEALEYAQNEKGIYTTNHSHIGFFSWEENATIDSISKEVFTSAIETDDSEPNEQKTYLNYPNGTLIYHDPKIGIEGLSVPSSDGTTIPGYAIFIFLGAGMLGLIIVFYRVKRNYAKFHQIKN
ncbi:MAG: hypothetical protein JSV62_15445 [Promethearchaeota archaeon]|nr:MAG: hypothetical protein JSV62_15445 [Candidatus Lokiarchaeota archaeon]